MFLFVPPRDNANCASDESVPLATVTTPSVVRPEKVIVPDELMPVAPVIAPPPEMSMVSVFNMLYLF